MTNAIQFEKIQKLKSQFAKVGQGLTSSDLGKEGTLNKIAYNLDERQSQIKLAIMGHALSLSKTSIEQMNVCFDMIKYFQFFSVDIFPDAEVSMEAILGNGDLIETFTAVMTENMRDFDVATEAYAFHVENMGGIEDQAIPKVEALMGDYDSALNSYGEVEAQLHFFMGRHAKTNMEYYDGDQRPNMRGKSPRMALSALFLQTAQNINATIDHSIDYATTLLAQIAFIDEKVIPENPKMIDQLNRQNYATYVRADDVITQIDRLVDIHDQRAAFAQLHLS